MPVLHVYDKVKSVRKGSGCHVELEDGTTFWLPPTAQQNYRHIQEGDKLLIDLSRWDVHKPSAAAVTVFRGHDSRPLTSFQLGHLDPPLKSPVLAHV